MNNYHFWVGLSVEKDLIVIIIPVIRWLVVLK